MQLGFIGAGNMATALCSGIIQAGVLRKDDVMASDPDPVRRRSFAAATGARTTPNNAEVCSCATVVLAVKPQVIPSVLREIGPLLGPHSLVISIAAGVPARRIEAASEKPIRVVRAMPNTPMLVAEGAAALCKGAHATDDDLARATRLFASCGLVIHVPEELLHAVTALSGSGPAYLFYLAEAMVAAGVEMGLSDSEALALTNQTLLGAARMLVTTGESAADLRRKVTSPSGTTEAAVRVLDGAAVAAKLAEAMRAACRRSAELAADDV